MLGGPFGQEPFGEDEEVVSVATPPVMRFPPLLSPAFSQALRVHYPSRCSIQLVASGDTPSGQLATSGGELVAGHVHIPCALGAFDNARPSDNERRDARVLEEFTRRACKLHGYYPAIVPRQMRAIVDGETYTIRGIEHDSQHVSTRLSLEVIDPRKLV